MIYKTLNTYVKFCVSDLVFVTMNISTPYLRSAGVISILYYGINSDMINLTGRSRNNEMLRHLHIQVEPVTRILSYLIIYHGT